MEDKKVIGETEQETEWGRNEQETVEIAFESRSRNEQFARVVTAVFAARLDPTVEELTEIKTAVSEAVSNSVIHGYSGWEDRSQAMVELECEINGNGRVTIIVRDHGRGIANVEKAMQPLFSTVESEERSGMGFTVMESFMDKLQVKSEEGKGTAVTMTKYLDLVSAL